MRSSVVRPNTNFLCIGQSFSSRPCARPVRTNRCIFYRTFDPVDDGLVNETKTTIIGNYPSMNLYPHMYADLARSPANAVIRFCRQRRSIKVKERLQPIAMPRSNNVTFRPELWFLKLTRNNSYSALSSLISRKLQVRAISYEYIGTAL